MFCGHEYTVTNLKFAATVEPDNSDVKNKLKEAINLRNQKDPTVPSTIGTRLPMLSFKYLPIILSLEPNQYLCVTGEEKKINPFMRVNYDSVKGYAKADDAVKTMTFVRKQKDSFKA